MLTLSIGGTEYFDEETETFEVREAVEVSLEHSLVSLSKWEAKYKKAFLGREEKTIEETRDYIAMMILPPTDPRIAEAFTNDDLEQIIEFVKDRQSATTFYNLGNNGPNREIITSELIYFWMLQHNVPFEAETWNLNRLFTLLQISSVKNGKQKKMSKSEIQARNRELNERRRQELGTSG